jgi:hypothetical protein
MWWAVIWVCPYSTNSHGQVWCLAVAGSGIRMVMVLIVGCKFCPQTTYTHINQQGYSKHGIIMKSHNAWPGQWNPQHEYQHYMTTSCYMIITGPMLLLQYCTTTTSNINNLTTTSNVYATKIIPCPCLILLHGVSYIPAKQKEFSCCRWTQRRQCEMTTKQQ